MSKIYYWANNTKKNSGEGILALNFLSLLKKKYKNYSFIKLNSFTHKENFFYNYILPIFGVFRLWKFHIKGKKVCYINYMPIWNILILMILPKKTIVGPITGSNLKTNIIYILLKHIGIFLLKKKIIQFYFLTVNLENTLKITKTFIITLCCIILNLKKILQKKNLTSLFILGKIKIKEMIF